MAKSMCFGCGSLVFELQTVEILDSHFPHCFIQCAKCGMPVGVVEKQNVGKILSEQAERDAHFRVWLRGRLQDIENRLPPLASLAQTSS